jgi:hypothetical protein
VEMVRLWDDNEYAGEQKKQCIEKRPDSVCADHCSEGIYCSETHHRMKIGDH